MNGAERIAALAAHLGYDADLYGSVTWDPFVFTDGGAEYLVVTDEEANDRAADAIERDLWAFNAEWLEEWTKLPAVAIRAIQEQMYEDASETFRTLIGEDFDSFVDDSVAADGRGHFLAGYDGEEIELPGGLYAFRVN